MIYKIFIFSFILPFLLCIDPNTEKQFKNNISIENLLKKLPPLMQNQVYVGYSKKNINPIVGPVPLGGFDNGNTRRADVNNQPYGIDLYETLVMFMDKEGSISVIITVDSIGMLDTNTNKMSIYVQNNTGIPKENISISCTHSHSTPDIRMTSDETMIAYQELLNNRTLEGVLECINDLTPANAFIGSTNVILENGKNALNFVRHYKTKNKDKKGNPAYAGPNHGKYGWNGTHYIVVTYTEHTTIADTELQLIKFDFGGYNKKELLLVNFQGHATITSGNDKLVISADWPAGLRDNLEKKKNCRVAYFAGAGGDNIPNTGLNNIGEGIPGITHNYTKDPSKVEEQLQKERSNEYGRILSEYALKIYDKLKRVNLGRVKTNLSTVALEYHIFPQNEINEGEYILKFWNKPEETLRELICGTYQWEEGYPFPEGFDKTGRKVRDAIRANYHILKNNVIVSEEKDGCQVQFLGGNLVNTVLGIISFIGLEYNNTIYSPYQAGNIRACSRKKEGEKKNVQIRSLNIGDLAFVSAPYEMFHENGKFIKENSKTKMTFILTYANGREGYIPTSKAFDYGCYESDTCQYKKGCGESLANGFVKMINDNYEISSFIKISLLSLVCLIFLL